MNIDAMGTERLIAYITKEVMRKIEESSKEKVEKNLDKILAISFTNKDLSGIDRNYFHIDYLEDLEGDVAINAYKYIILGNLSNKDLVAISLGWPGNKTTSLVIDFILQGKKIYVFNEGVEYHKYKDTANVHFYTMMQSYEEKLTSFGLEFINRNDLAKLVNSKDIQINSVYEDAKDAVEKTKGYIIKEKIITESLIKKVYEDGSRDIVINKSIIVTPLARDYIRDHGIRVLTR